MTTHPEIEQTRQQLLGLYHTQAATLATRPNHFLEELKHRAEDLTNSAVFTERTAAEINRAACVLILEDRRSK